MTEALKDPLWTSHQIGDTYTMDNKPDPWKIAYYPLFGTYKNGVWEDFTGEPKALIEKPIPGGRDFREIPLRYLKKTRN